jgi:two-component system response regulator DesR
MGELLHVVLAGIPPLIREGLRAALAAERDIRLATAVADGDGLLRDGTLPAAAVLLLDPGLPGPPLGALLTRLRAQRPDVRVLLLAGRAEAGWVGDVVALGVVGCLLVEDEPTTVVRALRLVWQGGLWFGPAFRAPPVAAGQEPLTAREREVLALLALGQGNAAIAATLSVSPRTIDFHVRNLLAKLDARSRTEAVHQARRRGLLPAAPALRAG